MINVTKVQNSSSRGSFIDMVSVSPWEFYKEMTVSEEVFDAISPKSSFSCAEVSYDPKGSFIIHDDCHAPVALKKVRDLNENTFQLHFFTNSDHGEMDESTIIGYCMHLVEEASCLSIIGCHLFNSKIQDIPFVYDYNQFFQTAIYSFRVDNATEEGVIIATRLRTGADIDVIATDGPNNYPAFLQYCTDGENKNEIKRFSLTEFTSMINNKKNNKKLKDLLPEV